MNAAITVKNLGKCYKVNHVRTRGGYRTIRESLSEAAGSAWDRLRGKGSGQSTEDFWALKDVDFAVQQGDVVGIIGRNGAGKSTLLKILSRITRPSTGQVEVRGRVGSLLEVGTGFHPELTGRENIYLNGAILGMSRLEIGRKFDEIAAFAEVDKFLDTPVKRYSSGMYVRLAFAVAAHLGPEVLLVDEVLAVGDAGFQKKCLGKMGDIGSSGRTILFVSHNMAAIQALCPRAVLLEAGQITYDGEAAGAVRKYLSNDGDDSQKPKGVLPAQLGAVSLRGFRIEDARGDSKSDLDFLEPFRLVIDIELTEYKRDLHALIILWRKKDGCRVASITTRELPCGELGLGETRLYCPIDPNPLLPGDYYWSVSLLNAHFRLQVDDVGSLAIRERVLAGCSHPFTSSHGTTHICSSIIKEYNHG
jgi:lipopolysaccharide transport system ATP-binding protein